MAIVLKNVKFNNNLNLYLDSNMIIGIMGNNYESFIKSLKGDNVFGIYKDDYFKKNSVYDELLSVYNKNNKIVFDEVVKTLLSELGLDYSFFYKKVKELSSSEKTLLKYLLLFMKNPSIMIIDEPFLYLDYYWKKKITLILKNIIKGTKKTIIIGSCDSEIIYMLSEKVLLVDYNYCIYGEKNKIFGNKEILDKYQIDEPEIIEFVRLAREKKIKLNYTDDVRDLIKDVYKNV